MKVFVLTILFLIILGQGITVNPTADACDCTKITTESDCLLNSKCQWTAPSTCAIKPTTTDPNPTPTTPTIPTYCSLVTDITTKCSSTRGCAYVDGKCTNFTGCTAYVKTTNADCQAISTQCISDGTYCISAKSCLEYATQNECEQNPSLSGTKKCKWENDACKDYVCTEADPTLTTNELCNNWLPGCVTTGKGCVQILGKCDSYSGDEATCQGYIGQDGTCKGEANGTQCKPKLCSEADATIKTDAACIAYSLQCVTNGKGCINSPLGPCSNYLGDVTACLGYVGSDGLCTGDEGGTKCRIKQCTDSSISNNTDALCDTFLAGCVTKGKGCISSLGLCSSYTGTTDVSCDGLIGSDGYCKGTVGPCQVKLCTDAPVTTKTDFACNAYQLGCITTGKGCVSKLGPCSGYQGTIDTCEGYVGVDGYCKGAGSASQACAAKVCSEASKEINTNEACKAYQIGCVTTGKGCINELKTCSNFTGTTVTCDGYIGTDGKCKGTSDTVQGCARKRCDEAPLTYTTNDACGYYQTGCIANDAVGVGCTSSIGPCVEYLGTVDTCKTYIGIDGKCQGSSQDTRTSCTRKLCSEAPQTYTTDEECNYYSTGCVTNGKGCVSQLNPCFWSSGNSTTCQGLIGSDGFCYGKEATSGVCTAIQVIDVCLNTLNETECAGQCSWNGICVGQSKCFDFTTPAICKANKVTNSTTPCFWTGSTCRELLCTDAPDTHNTDSLCNQFLSGCLTNGHGCLAQSAPCNLYYGTREECSKYTKKCWNTIIAASTARCTERECADSTQTANDLECDTFKSGCKANGAVCIDGKLPCSSYQGKQAKCATFLGNKGTQKCWNTNTAADNTPCITKQCSDNTTSTTDSDCDLFLSGCVTNGSGCISKSLPCSSYNCDQTLCENFKGLNGTQPCWRSSPSGVGACIIRECSHAPSTANSNSACEQFLKGCFYDGRSCKSSSQACSTFEGVYDQCISFKGNGKSCYKLDKCAERACSDLTKAENDEECKKYLSTCVYFKGKCTNIGACNTYNGTSQSDCSDIDDNSKPSQKCWWKDGSATCINRACENAPNNTEGKKDKAVCLTHSSILKCQYNGEICVDIKNCDDYQSFGDSIELKQQTCMNMINTAGKSCWYSAINDGTGLKCTERLCSNVPNPTNQQNCDDHTQNCLFYGGACIAITDCNKYQSIGTDDERKQKCEAYKNKDNQHCVWRSGDYCEDKTCDNVLNVINQQSCDTYLPKSCLFQEAGTIKKCVKKTCDNFNNTTNCDVWLPDCFENRSTNLCYQKASCNTFTLDVTLSEESKNRYCANMINQAGVGCGHDLNDTKCTERTCSNAFSYEEQDCKTWLSKCRWINSKCVNALPCDQVDVVGTTDAAKSTFCQNMKDNSTVPQLCIYHASTSTTKCSSKTCANISTAPTTTGNCQTYLETCTLNYTSPLSCIESSTPCTGFKGTPIQCQESIIGTNGTERCWSTSDITSKTVESCKKRICSHNTTAETDIECSNFLPGCKTNGKGCVDLATQCSDLSGSPETCSIRQSADGKFCKAGVSVFGNCKDKTCNDNVISTTDQDCKEYMSNCLTKGIGCISKDEPCSSYAGTQEICKTFTASNGTKKCWNTSSATSKTSCIEKKCADDKLSMTDQDCALTQSTCVTKGVGCIEKSVACGSYTGNQGECNAFKGLNGTKQCWNTSQFSRTACINKECTHNTTATTDKECQEFMPQINSYSPINCVTNGNGCVAYPKACSQFTGTNAQCSKFTATDGPCKLSKQFQTGNCTPKLCEEAENTNDTDELCKAYHPSCVTNGYGCVTKIQCKNIVVQKACAAKSGCLWVNNCRTIEKDCAKLTSQGASVCANTPVSTGLKKCFWQFNACVAFSCDNLREIQSTHETCNAQYPQCTTKGYGCILMGACNTYLTQTICEAAKTTDPGNTCIWSSNKCRAKQCVDQTVGSSDAVCQTFLSGCKTNGQSCIDQIFQCESLVTQSVCIKDSSNKPCFWANDACYTYEKCEDVNLISHSDCQKFSKQCTSDGTKCIAIRQCAQFTSQISCIVGTDGDCGWLQASNLCKKFSSCSDVSAGDNYTCQAYQSSCISDGKTCIQKQNCSKYETQISCDYGGTDGKCQYSSKTCRLRKCTDATASNATSIKTHVGCYDFQADEKCTTNGVSCIPLSTCSSYTKEEGCIIGTDGICIWGAPVSNKDSITKSCRTKVCEDFPLVQSYLCKSALTSTECISNGTNCIKKSVCSSYTSYESCHADGIDGDCAFIAKSLSSSVGTCKLMTTCSDANFDMESCNRKSFACNWKGTCSDHTCSTKAIGSTCVPVPSFDQKSYTICVPTGGSCTAGEGSSLTQPTCYGQSMGTYTWNAAEEKCKACFERPAADSTPNPDSNTDKPIFSGLLFKGFTSVVIMVIILT